MSNSEVKQYERYFEQVLAEHRAVIARVVSSYEMLKPLQEELFQEISVALWKALHNFDKQSSLKTYVLSIAHKRSISHVAKYAKIPKASDIESVEVVGSSCPSRTFNDDQKTTRLVKAIRLLPMLDRQLVTLALEGLSYKEIAEILGITVSNVGVKLNRAKQKLKQYLAEEQ